MVLRGQRGDVSTGLPRKNVGDAANSINRRFGISRGDEQSHEFRRTTPGDIAQKLFKALTPT
jgi:hypothetical protein